MPLPSSLIISNLIVCERVLQEEDKALSLIRMVDLFVVSGIGEGHFVEMHVNASCKFHHSDTGKHVINILLIRPTAGTMPLACDFEFELSPAIEYPLSPTGATVTIKVNVTAREEGVHFFAMLVDGAEAARYPFTLALRKDD